MNEDRSPSGVSDRADAGLAAEIAASLARAEGVDALCGNLHGGLARLYQAPRGVLNP